MIFVECRTHVLLSVIISYVFITISHRESLKTVTVICSFK